MRRRTCWAPRRSTRPPLPLADAYARPGRGPAAGAAAGAGGMDGARAGRPLRPGFARRNACSAPGEEGASGGCWRPACAASTTPTPRCGATTPSPGGRPARGRCWPSPTGPVRRRCLGSPLPSPVRKECGPCARRRRTCRPLPNRPNACGRRWPSPWSAPVRPSAPRPKNAAGRSANSTRPVCWSSMPSSPAGDVVGAVQVGDGAVGLYHEDGTCLVLGEADHGAYASETRFLTTPRIDEGLAGPGRRRRAAGAACYCDDDRRGRRRLLPGEDAAGRAVRRRRRGGADGGPGRAAAGRPARPGSGPK